MYRDCEPQISGFFEHLLTIARSFKVIECIGANYSHPRKLIRGGRRLVRFHYNAHSLGMLNHFKEECELDVDCGKRLNLSMSLVILGNNGLA